MEFWLALPFADRQLSPRLLLDIGRQAEALGFTGVVTGDHIAVPRQYNDRHGFNYECLTMLAFLAAATSALRLGTSVVVASLRNPIVLAKQVATLDVLSGGRVTLGLAAGYSQREFVTLGADFSMRGAWTDETIAILRHLFAGTGEPYAGRFFELDDYTFAPLPPQGAALPILVGDPRSRHSGELPNTATFGSQLRSRRMRLRRACLDCASSQRRAADRCSPGPRSEWASRSGPTDLRRVPPSAKARPRRSVSRWTVGYELVPSASRSGFRLSAISRSWSALQPL
jgi:hypothetical protein